MGCSSVRSLHQPPTCLQRLLDAVVVFASEELPLVKADHSHALFTGRRCLPKCYKNTEREGRDEVLQKYREGRAGRTRALDGCGCTTRSLAVADTTVIGMPAAVAAACSSTWPPQRLLLRTAATYLQSQGESAEMRAGEEEGGDRSPVVILVALQFRKGRVRAAVALHFLGD